ncbi:MAG: FtsX-like permease family protein [Cyclobacteriaceae bacterium]
MLKLKLSILLRTLYRYRLNTAIAVLGFSIALACAMVLLMKVYFALSTDRQHAYYDRIYRTVQHIKRGDGVQKVSSANYPMAEAVRQELPQAEAASMVQFGEYTLRQSANSVTPIKSNVAYAENSIFNIFSFEVLAGDQSRILEDPFKVVISVNQASKLYGLPVDQAHDAIGKELLIDGEAYIVEAIISDYQNPTDYPFDIIASFQTLRRDGVMLNGWMTASSDVNCYFLAPVDFDIQRFEQGLEQLKNKYLAADAAASKDILTQPLSDIHFNNDYSNFTYKVESKESIYAMLAVALVLIILAVINYINLSTAQSVARSKEVGIRKVMGSSRRDLVAQFMSESFLITLVSLFFALVLVELCYLNFNDMLNFPPSFSVLTSLPVIGLFVALLLIVTFLSGYYPALILSGYQIAETLKVSMGSQKSGKLNLRRSLIVLQYVATQVLVIITLVVTFQLDHFLSRPMGFDQEAKVTFPLPGNELLNLQSLRQQLINDPAVENVTFTLGAPHTGQMFTTLFGIGMEEESHDNLTEVALADPSFPKVFNLELLAGRLLDSDTSHDILINERMMGIQGFDDPADAIGQSFSVFGERLKIAGVVKDFHMQSLHGEIKPLVISAWNEHYYEGIVSLSLGSQYSSADVTAAIDRIRAIWTGSFPDDFFEAKLFDDVIRAAYQNEINTAKALNLFTIVAIVISCLGLFGLISFLILQRTKEIGVRKVLGASAVNISYIFSREFMLLMIVAAAIAIPVGYQFAQTWLDQFAYRIGFSVYYAVGAVALSALVTAVSIVTNLISASSVSPTRLLRAE